MPSMPNKREQIEAILTGRTWELAAKYYGGDLARWTAERVVSLEDLVEYVNEHGLPPGWAHTEPGTADGVYLVASDTKFVCYAQERGQVVPDTHRSFDSHDEALRYFLRTNYLP